MTVPHFGSDRDSELGRALLFSTNHIHVLYTLCLPLTNILVIEDPGIPSVGILAPQLPDIEKWLPVNVGNEFV